MTVLAQKPDDILPSLGLVSALYVVLTLLAFWLVRPLGLKLMAVGVLTGLLSAWCAVLAGVGAASVEAGRAPTGAVGRVVIGGDAAGVLGRVAVLLVLGGLAVEVLGRWVHPAAPAETEGTSRANPA